MAVEAGEETSLERAAASQLSVRLLAPDEAPLHAALLAAGFEAPQQLFEQLITPGVLAMPTARCYVGSVDGETVATALGLSGGDHVGVYNVATMPEHRGLGYGAAISARAALDGFAAGASYAYLQSSAAGYRVYQRLGFEELEAWALWTSGG